MEPDVDRTAELQRVEPGGDDEHRDEDPPQDDFPQNEDHARSAPQMDEEDVAEMSMIAAQIESAEDFDLTFETVDTSVVEEVERPKSRKSKKSVSPLYKSDADDVEEFLEEGVEQAKEQEKEQSMVFHLSAQLGDARKDSFLVENANVSIAESLLNDWGTPNPERLLSARRRSAESVLIKEVATTPTSRKPLRDVTSLSTGGRRSTSISKKRSSNSPGENDPLRKRRPSASSKVTAGGTLSAPRYAPEFKTPLRSAAKSKAVSAQKQPLRMRNL
ncbi:unnamed protein product [Nippostrongylus brasiliensis]|uniref:RAD51_interact domain-containing protein n=1 Tax=Nippostrongylus brasiliensis TaxID=27835 RepID=A0A158QZD6_NIPBR|nr:unnamed protein product [Nippostrongylus brasiliensis]